MYVYIYISIIPEPVAILAQETLSAACTWHCVSGQIFEKMSDEMATQVRELLAESKRLRAAVEGASMDAHKAASSATASQSSAARAEDEARAAKRLRGETKEAAAETAEAAAAAEAAASRAKKSAIATSAEVGGLASMLGLLQGRVDALYARLITPGPVIAEAASEYMTISKAEFAEMRKEICELQAKLQDKEGIPPNQ